MDDGLTCTPGGVEASCVGQNTAEFATALIQNPSIRDGQVTESGPDNALVRNEISQQVLVSLLALAAGSSCGTTRIRRRDSKPRIR